MRNLGFDQKSHHKSVYFDGNERDDVTEYRKEFVDRMFELENACTQGILHNYNQERSQQYKFTMMNRHSMPMPTSLSTGAMVP